MQMVPLQMYPSGQQYPVESLQQWYPYRQLPEPQASPVSHPLTKRKVNNYKQEAQETHQSPEQLLFQKFVQYSCMYIHNKKKSSILISDL